MREKTDRRLLRREERRERKADGDAFIKREFHPNSAAEGDVGQSEIKNAYGRGGE